MEEEEMMMMMMTSIRNPDHITPCASWKLYENPYFNSHQKQEEHHRQSQFNQIASSFLDLNLIRAIMESELEFARSQIVELKAELEFERRCRKRAELMNKKLAKELGEERSGKETLKRVCEKLAREVSSEKCEIDLMKREIEEERKMLRMAEVLREERVQMKLADAKRFLEDKLSEIGKGRRSETHKQEEKPKILSRVSSSPSNLSEKFLRLVMGDKTSNQKTEEEEEEDKTMVLREKSASCNDSNRQYCVQLGMQQKKVISEAENPHIKRGIKGFVEFPRVIRAIRSRSGNWGTKIECQKAQLKILLRQRSTPRSVNLVAG